MTCKDRHDTYGAGLRLRAVLGLRLGRDHEVGLLAGQLAGLLTRDGDPDRHAVVVEVVELGRLDVEVLAAIVDVLAIQQGRDDVDGLGQHLVPRADRRPAPADDVRVEVLAGAEPEADRPSNRICIVAAFWATTAGW
jgi:hypothetical protein